MKVVLFCGGMGLRMAEASERVPKPMILVGDRPMLWHIMKYFAHHGHTDFVICVGHQAEVIREYFFSRDGALADGFTRAGGPGAENDMEDWRITVVDTGLQANVGERLRRVRRHLEGEELFLAHYGDTLTDAPLPELIGEVRRTGKIANFLCVPPRSYTFHTVEVGPDQGVRSIRDINRSDIWINGGYFVLRTEIFDYMNPGEELVHEPFQRLIDAGQLLAHRYDGFWAPMDTLKDRQLLEQLAETGNPPWAVWNGDRHAVEQPGVPSSIEQPGLRGAHA